jgi:hypothetical protein
MKKEIKDGLNEIKQKMEGRLPVFIENVPFFVKEFNVVCTGFKTLSVEIKAEFVDEQKKMQL